MHKKSVSSPDLPDAQAWPGLLLESIAQAVLVADAADRIVQANGRALRCFGYTEAQMLACCVEDLMPERFRTQYQRMRRHFTSTPAPRMMGSNRYLCGLRQDGSEFPAEIGLGTWGDGSQRYVVLTLTDITARRQAENKIQQLSLALAERVQEKTQRLTLTEAALAARTQDLRQALLQVGMVERQKIEEERKRLSQDLHDEIGQMLAALSFNLEVIRRKNTQPELLAPLQVAIDTTANVVEGVRHIIHHLRPPQLDEFGLVAALRWHVQHLQKSSPMRLVLEDATGGLRLSPDIDIGCFRIVQESLTNALRHSSATQVRIRLERLANALQVVVQDDGVGFQPEAPVAQGISITHLGQRGMRERARGLGGELDIVSQPGQGCTICATIPLNLG